MINQVIFIFMLQFFFSLFLSSEGGSELTGNVVLPNQKDYDQSRLVSNYYPSKDSFPTAIVYCESSLDVQNAVKWAACKKIPIRIRSGRHNHEGFSTGKGLVIDVSRMKKVEVDQKTHIATIQPGITGGELYQHLAKKGLTQAGGTCSDVGISGLVLSGGMGPLVRQHGLTCDTLIALDRVHDSIVEKSRQIFLTQRKERDTKAQRIS